MIDNYFITISSSNLKKIHRDFENKGYAKLGKIITEKFTQSIPSSLLLIEVLLNIVIL